MFMFAAKYSLKAVSPHVGRCFAVRGAGEGEGAGAGEGEGAEVSVATRPSLVARAQAERKSF